MQNITVNTKIIIAGITPTAELSSLTTGLGAVVVMTGNDTAGNITYTSGTQDLPANPLAAGEQANITFTNAFSAAPRIALTPKNSGSAGVRYYVETTTTGFVMHFIDAPAPTTNYAFDYIVIQ